jgi:NAD(P)-dependent dehydrogenase (short-subunit alcohol dehydrogenase family)
MSRGSSPVVVVTGAARGIGRAAATALQKAGFSVVAVDIDDVGGTEAVADLERRGGEHAYVHADMCRVQEVRQLMDVAVDRFGRLDVLVNNAATTRAIDFFDVSEADWDRILQLNAKGYFFAMQAAAVKMAEAGSGSIVPIASIAGKGWKETSNIAYASSKGAVIAMTRIAAARLGPAGIRVNAICPGMTKTEMMLGWLAGRASQQGVPQETLLAEMAQQVPLGLLNEPTDVAAAVVFLGSQASRTITGQSLNVDGGILFD